MGKFYVTTPIFYVNDKPHIGHAYTVIAADILARWHRLAGDEVFFLTGTDEHGEKVEKAAADAGKTPKAFTDEVVDKFKTAWKALNISYDKFVRTTDEDHINRIKNFVSKLTDNGDIYKGEYEGWYCVPDETFLTETELVDGKCRVCGREVKKVKEENYFFRLSKYQDALLKLYSDNPGFLSPKYRADEIINIVKGGLRDLSISRATVKWGIPFPGDPQQTIYVWLDALPNYITALGWPEAASFNTFWPADVHIMGKEIFRFHTIYWPAFLLSAGLKPPNKVFAHGWFTVNGQKMSKSLHNVVDPLSLVNKYGADPVRFALIREMEFGRDGDFSEEFLVEKLNGELSADLGNLLSRTLAIAEKFSGEIKGEPEPGGLVDIKEISSHIDKLEIHEALEKIWRYVRSINKYVNDKKPWSVKGPELGNILYNVLESIRISAILLSPFIPETCEKIFGQLGVEAGGLKDAVFKEFKGKVTRGPNLFVKVQ